MENKFKNNYPFDKRFNESSAILSKYPGRVPIIVEKTNYQ